MTVLGQNERTHTRPNKEKNTKHDLTEMTKKNLKRSKDTEIAQAAEEDHHEIPISNDNFQQSYYPSNEQVAQTLPHTDAALLNTEEARKRATYQETTTSYKKARKNTSKLIFVSYCTV